VPGLSGDAHVAPRQVVQRLQQVYEVFVQDAVVDEHHDRARDLRSRRPGACHGQLQPLQLLEHVHEAHRAPDATVDDDLEHAKLVFVELELAQLVFVELALELVRWRKLARWWIWLELVRTLSVDRCVRTPRCLDWLARTRTYVEDIKRRYSCSNHDES
jgi:hypothetical protein